MRKKLERTGKGNKNESFPMKVSFKDTEWIISLRTKKRSNRTQMEP